MFYTCDVALHQKGALDHLDCFSLFEIYFDLLLHIVFLTFEEIPVSKSSSVYLKEWNISAWVLVILGLAGCCTNFQVRPHSYMALEW